MNLGIDELAVPLENAGYLVVEAGPLSYYLLDTRTHRPGMVYEAGRSMTPDELMQVARTILTGVPDPLD